MSAAPVLNSRINPHKPNEPAYWWTWPDGSKSVELESEYAARYWLDQKWAKPQQEPTPNPSSMKPAMRDLLGALQCEERVDWDLVDGRTVLALRRRGYITASSQLPGIWVPTAEGMEVNCD